MVSAPPSSVRGIRDALSWGTLTSRGLVEHYASRIHDDGDRWRCYRELNLTEARAVADAFDRDTARPVGSLSGIPVGVKDVFHLARVPARAGSAATPRGSTAESGLSRRLRTLSSPVLGLQTCHEFAYGPLGDVSFPAPAVNPRDPDLVPGGSSSGSAVAVATGLAPLSFGTDTGGSIRTPAAFNGLVGFKPAANRVDTTGMIHLSPSLDRVGPIAADVESAFLGWCALDPAAMDATGMGELAEVDIAAVRIGRLAGPSFDDLDAVVGAGYESFLSRLGTRAASQPAQLDTAAGIEAQATIVAAEAWRLHGEAAGDDASGIGAEVAGRIRHGELVGPRDLRRARERANAFDAAVQRLLDRFDVLICPTTPIAIPPVGARRHARGDGTSEHLYRAVTRHTAPFNASAVAALTVPYLVETSNPLGVQLIARAGAEALVFGLAATIERKYRI